MGITIPRSCRKEYIILLWDLMRAMGNLALEGKRFSSADGRWIPWGGPRGNGCWTNRPTRENSLPQTVGNSPTQKRSVRYVTMWPLDFVTPGLPLFLKGKQTKWDAPGAGNEIRRASKSNTYKIASAERATCVLRM